MGYYRGDYYTGDGNYYRGDFLGIGHALSSGIKSVAKFAYNALVPAPVRAVASAVGNVVHPSLPKTALMLAGGGPQTGLVNVGGTGTQTGLFNFAGGGPPPGALTAGLPMPGTKGYHLNKSTYETRGGGTSRWGGAGSLSVHPKGTVLVRNRRMNVGNARALKRALRRAGGFARLARRVMSFTHPKAGRGHFKFKRRAKR